jgi:hypothetical protein
MRIAYTTFYRPLGVEPEEVGLTYAHTLERAALPLVVLCISWLAFVAIFWGVGFVIDLAKSGASKAFARARGEPSSGWNLSLNLGSIASYAIVVAVALLFARPMLGARFTSTGVPARSVRGGARGCGIGSRVPQRLAPTPSETPLSRCR